jgi:hypothetical protein
MPDGDPHDRAALARQALLLAGLAPVDMESPAAGGFALDVHGEDVYLVWLASESLRHQMYDHMAQGQAEHPLVHHVGTVCLAMVEAMVTILQSAGIPARLSTDYMETGAAKL